MVWEVYKFIRLSDPAQHNEAKWTNVEQTEEKVDMKVNEEIKLILNCYTDHSLQGSYPQ